MATIERITGKTGQTFRITVSGGFDTSGKRIRHRTTFKPSPGMTEKQIQKAVQRAAVDFERSIEQGYVLDNRQTFAEYAAYVLALKERTGVRATTLDRYRGLLQRINAAIGHIKLVDLRPQHLNTFYKNLSEPGIRTRDGSATAKDDLSALLKKHSLSRIKIAEKAGISAATVGAAAGGKSIDTDSLVSMNMWALTPEFVDLLDAGFVEFFEKAEPANPMKAEYLLPIYIDELLHAGKVSVKVLPTHDKWFGVTYAEDKQTVIDSFAKLVADGVYKKDLFSDLKK